MNEWYVAIAIGAVISLFVSEKFQRLPGGLIVPGYLSLLIVEPLAMILTLATSLLTYGVVVKVFAKSMILFGRRKFVMMIVTGLSITLFFHYFLVREWQWLEIGIGFIVPGLIANAMERQGVLQTMFYEMFL